MAAFRPRFPVENGDPCRQAILPVLLLAETGLAHGDRISLSVHGYQRAPDLLQAAIYPMRLDSASGNGAQPSLVRATGGSQHGRGELVRGPGRTATSGAAGDFEIKIEDVEIAGAFIQSPDRSTDEPNTIGILVEFTNRSADQDVWIYAPCLCRGATALARLPEARPLPTAYRGIPRTIQKLWRGEPLHIMHMGSSITAAAPTPDGALRCGPAVADFLKQPPTGETSTARRSGIRSGTTTPAGGSIISWVADGCGAP